MARIITKEHAEAIVTKLHARLIPKKKARAHDVYAIYHNGRRIAHVGIRHGSKKGQGHDHVPGQIHVGPRDAKLLAECNHTDQWWIEQMQAKGVIEPETTERTEPEQKA